MTKRGKVDYAETRMHSEDEIRPPHAALSKDGADSAETLTTVQSDRPSSIDLRATQNLPATKASTESGTADVKENPAEKSSPADTPAQDAPRSKLQTFWQGVLHIDTKKMEPWIGVRNALGVALPLAVGTAIGMPLGGLALASGALNVSYSDGHDPYKQRARRMLASSALCAIAVMAGGLAGHHTVAAILLATIWAFGSGMAITLGPTAESLGVISVVVLIIYSAQALTPARALQAGGLAFAGGVLQMVLSLALWPVRAYEPERRALANLYLALGRAASSPAQLMKAPPSVEASTQAQEALAGRASDHNILSERFRSLLNQAERTRLRLFTLGRLLRRMRREKFGFAPAELVESFLGSIGHVLTAIGESLFHNAALKIDQNWLSEMHNSTETVREKHETSEKNFLAVVVRDARHQMDALAGQARAAIRMVTDVTADGFDAVDQSDKKLPWRMRYSSILPRVAANLTLRSAVFRHGVRLAAAVAIAETLSRNLETQRAYWLPMTAVLVLKPEFTVTFTRGLLRIAGTMVGLLLATAMFHVLPPDAAVEVVLIGMFVFLLRWVGPANYGIFAVAVSALVVLMIAITGVAPKAVILARGVNTILGGVLALLAYAAWPTWERMQVGELIARLLDSYREYFLRVVDALEGNEGTSTEALDKLRLKSRLARTNAVASVDRMQAEPGTRAQEVALLIGMLASSHRFIHAVLSVEAGILPVARPAVRDEFRGFAAHVSETLAGLAAELRRTRAANQKWPDLREDHRRLVQNPLSAGEQYALVNVEADRMANSLNTLREQVEGWRRLKRRPVGAPVTLAWR